MKKNLIPDDVKEDALRSIDHFNRTTLAGTGSESFLLGCNGLHPGPSELGWAVESAIIFAKINLLTIVGRRPPLIAAQLSIYDDGFGVV